VSQDDRYIDGQDALSPEDFLPVEEPPLPKEGEHDLLASLGCDEATRAIYDFLYRRRSSPPTMVEIRAMAAARQGEAHSQTDRRVRYLREIGLDVPAVRDGKQHRYHLRGWRPGGPRKGGPKISRRIRAEVLAPQRCAQCGRTPLDHGVVLVVDHKIPQNWNGGDEIENLQPLCEDCNGGKRDFYSSHDANAERIKKAIALDSPHMRIGELLLAFDGGWVPGDLIGIVASAQAYQEDWQKRLRELRTLGWKIEHQKRHNEGARIRTYYRVTHSEPWPPGDPGAEIRRREKAGKAAKNAALEAAGLTPDEDDEDPSSEG
jgi:5-methylcytosine-specific restriction endonuclease McrA